MTDLRKSSDYLTFLDEIKQRIQAAQLKAARAVQSEQVILYWHIGKEILEKQKNSNWGSGFVKQFAHDLQVAFPGMKGLSPRNLERMRQLATIYPDEIATQAVSQLPWGHILLLIQRVTDISAREWYADKTVQNGWSRSILEMQIEQQSYRRQALEGQKTSNFKERLPSPASDLAHEMLKDPYTFDFLSLGDEAHERAIEQALTEHITRFLLELGSGFAFVGRQVPISVGEGEFHIDMLFYHVRLRCYVVIELKAKEFKPADVGQLNFYLTAVDNELKHPDDGPTIGILLCKKKDKVVAEYALQGIDKPMGVSQFQLTRAMPDELQTSLPTIEELEAELSDVKLEDKGSDE